MAKPLPETDSEYIKELYVLGLYRQWPKSPVFASKPPQVFARLRPRTVSFPARRINDLHPIRCAEPLAIVRILTFDLSAVWQKPIDALEGNRDKKLVSFRA